MRIRWLILECAAVAWLLCGCKTSRSAESDTHIAGKLDTGATDAEHAQASGETKQGPTWEFEFAQPGPLSPDGSSPPLAGESTNSAGSEDSLRGSGDRRAAPVVPDGLPPHGALLKATYHGGIDTTWQASSDGLAGTETHVVLDVAQDTKTASSMKPAAGCALGLGFWTAVALIGAGALAWVFRRALFPWWPK